MFCTKCGFKNDDDALFCGGCGSMLNNEQNQSVDEGDTQDNNFEASVTSEESDAGETTVLKPEDFPEFPDQEKVNEAEMKANETTMNPEQQYNEYQQMHSMQNQNNMMNQGAGQSNMMNQNAGQPNMMNQNAGQPNMMNQNMGQPNMMQNQFGNQQFNARPQYNNQFGKPNQTGSSKFSVKRLIFSAIIIIASILASVSILFNYVGIKMKSDFGNETEYSKGREIIKDKPDISDFEMDDEDTSSNAKDLSDNVNLFRYVVIALEIALVLFALIDIILLSVVRQRIVYILSLVFGFIKLGLALFATYLWSFTILDGIKKVFSEAMEGMLSSSLNVKLIAVIGPGLVITIIAEGLVIISSIILMTCKDREKKQVSSF